MYLCLILNNCLQLESVSFSSMKLKCLRSLSKQLRYLTIMKNHKLYHHVTFLINPPTCAKGISSLPQLKQNT